MNQTALLDTAAALALMDGDMSILLMILPIVSEQMNTDRHEIAEAIKTSDTARIKAVSHRLKSSVGYIGAMRAQSACARLESAAEHADAGVLAELRQQLETEIDALAPAIATYLARQAAPANSKAI